MQKEIWKIPSVVNHTQIITRSYSYWMGKEIFPGVTNKLELAKKIYYAPFVVVSHGTQDDPVFNYANQLAQNLWEINWEEFTSMPSRLSAEPMEESKRHALLEEGRKKGITFLEKGVRINKTGRRFYIKDVILFNLRAPSGNYLGQGAIYSDWEFLS